MNRILFFVLIIFPFLSHARYEQVPKNHFKRAKEDLTISPYTGYTRMHWLEITEQIIAGVLPYFNPETGMPQLADDPAEPAYSKIRDKNPREEGKRALERIMMAVIIYTKATGNDRVPGYRWLYLSPFYQSNYTGNRS